MKIFYRPIIDRLREDMFVLDRYDLVLLRCCEDCPAGVLLLTVAICAVAAFILFDKQFKKTGWIVVAIGVIAIIGIVVLPSSREQYLLDIANKNSLNATEFELVLEKLTNEADLRVPVKGKTSTKKKQPVRPSTQKDQPHEKQRNPEQGET